jgi:Amt family ammonium transporter
LLFAGSAPALAQTATPTLNSGDTAWMLISSVIVLMMTVPGLALYYGGLLRRKNILAMLMQCFFATALISVLWCVIGYSLAFTAGSGPLAPFVGAERPLGHHSRDRVRHVPVHLRHHHPGADPGRPG